MIGPSGFSSAYARGLSFHARSSGVPGNVMVMPAREAMQVAKIRKMPMAVRARVGVAGDGVGCTRTLYDGIGEGLWRWMVGASGERSRGLHRADMGPRGAAPYMVWVERKKFLTTPIEVVFSPTVVVVASRGQR